jgi:fatty-acyl-CoA synthase
MMEGVSVVDPETMQPVPEDGNTMGEVMIRGNIVMKGYFKNPAATQEAFAGGWFHTGDLAVSHGNGRFEIKDRSKGSPAAVHTHNFQCNTHPVTSPGADIIISGGENISSIEVQNILMTHPGVLEAGGGRGGHAGREVGRGAVRLRGPQPAGEPAGERGGADRVGPR